MVAGVSGARAASNTFGQIPTGLNAAAASRDEHQEQTTPPSAEGPYFRPNSPERGDFVDAKSDGHPVTLEGRVLSRACRPVARALLDLWHADQDGVYDDSGFRCRGHIYSDAQGHYEFRTIQPALYPGRTRHFHFKVQAPGRQVFDDATLFSGRAAQSGR